MKKLNLPRVKGASFRTSEKDLSRIEAAIFAGNRGSEKGGILLPVADAIAETMSLTVKTSRPVIW
jgi:hypothetical protein